MEIRNGGIQSVPHATFCPAPKQCGLQWVDCKGQCLGKNDVIGLYFSIDGIGIV